MDRTVRYNRREFLKNSGLTAAMLAAGGCSKLVKNAGSRRPPNLLVFLADDLGYGDLSCYGHPFIRTPNLDRLAREGMLFTDFYSASSICSPSRCGLLTGRFPYRAGVYHLAGKTVHLREKEITVAEQLKETGYKTFFAGKWHLGKLDDKHPTPGDQGFEYWFATMHNDGPRNPSNFFRNGRRLGELRGWYCELVVDEAIGWLKKHNHNKPFFMEICSHEPHTALDPPANYKKMYDKPEVRELEETLEYGRVPRYPGDNSPEQKRFYYGTVTQLDAAFGRLLRELDRMGLRQNTLVLFTSDNGPEYPGGSTSWDRTRELCGGTPGKLRGMKRYLYEGGIRIPGIVRWPERIRAGSKCRVPAGSVDILPTFCELAGAEVPSARTIDGVSIAPLFTGGPVNRTKPLCWNINFTGTPNMTIRVADYVLVGFASSPSEGQTLMEWIKRAKIERFEMYNVRKDRRQEMELSEKEPARFAKLVSQMKQLWAELQNAGPIWEGYKGSIKPAQLEVKP